MSWNSIGDFTILTADPDILTLGLAVNENNLYVVLSNGELWRYNGISWSDTGEAVSGGPAFAIYAWDDDIYLATYAEISCGTTGGIYRYNETDGLVVELLDTGQCFTSVNFVEYDGDIYLTYRSNELGFISVSVLKRNGGSWDDVVGSNQNNTWALGVYNADLYLSQREGGEQDGTNHLREWNGANFSTSVFSEVSGGTIIFYDEFVDPNNTLLTDHTPDIDTVGGGWVNIIESAQIIGNSARRVNSNGFMVVADVGATDVFFTCDITISETGSGSFTQGLVARVQDVDNYWLFQYQAGGTLEIIEMNGGTPTSRGSVSTGISDGETYQFRVDIIGDDLHFTVGNDSLSFTSSFLNTETRCGMYMEDSFTAFDNFRVTDGINGDFHVQGRRMLQFNDDLYLYDNRYIHRWISGSSWVLDQAFDFDLNTINGMRDMIVFDGKLWAGTGTSIWVRDGGTWSEDADSDIGYQQEVNNSVALSLGGEGTLGLQPFTWNPPIGFATYNAAIYVCAGPGHVYVREATPGLSVRGIGIAKSTSNDERIWITLWKESVNEIYLRAYFADTLTPDAEFLLSFATAAQINAGTVIAYPYIPPNAIAGEVYVFGRFFYQPAATHIIHTVNAGSSFSVIEDGWDTDVCGSMLLRGNQIYAVRNKSTLGHLYKGISSLGFVSVLGFPVNPYAFNISPNLNRLWAGNKFTGNPRVLATSYPFLNWTDATLNYPVSGSVKSVVLP